MIPYLVIAFLLGVILSPMIQGQIAKLGKLDLNFFLRGKTKKGAEWHIGVLDNSRQPPEQLPPADPNVLKHSLGDSDDTSR